MKRITSILIFSLLSFQNIAAYTAPAFPFTQDVSIHMNSGNIAGWATGYENLSYGAAVDSTWKTPAKALGHADGNSYGIVCLGRGGQITLTFSQGISNGPGYDFAIFENGVSETFLELAWVEVSSDGIHFIRFPNYSYTESAVSGFGNVDPSFITGLASKFKQGYGTQFDLSELQSLHTAVKDEGYTNVSASYRTQLLNNFDDVNFNNIRYIRIIDIIGNGTAKDSEGFTIYDPYPTTGSAGFDLDAVAVLHTGVNSPPPANTFINWAADHQLNGDPSADSDNDGSSNLEEYFLGSNPTNHADTASFSGRPLAGQMELQFFRDPDALGTISFESSSNLTDWAASTPSSITSNTVSETTEVRVTLPFSETRGFYRLRFEGAVE